jgi:hypothetical protein
MANNVNELGSLGEEACDYLKIRWARMRLGTIDRLSTATAKLLWALLAVALLLFASVFLMFALAMWIGEVSGRLSLGFLAAGGVFLAAGVVVFFVGRRMFANSTVRYFVDLFFTDNEH